MSPHYKTMYDESEMLFAYDIAGKGDVTVTIEKVEGGTILGDKGRKTKKPFVSFRGAKKKLAINKTNGRTIAQLYGNDTAGWIGKPIVLYATTTTFGSDTVECVRIRPFAPKSNGNGKSKSTVPATEAEAREALGGDSIDQPEEGAAES